MPPPPLQAPNQGEAANGSDQDQRDHRRTAKCLRTYSPAASKDRVAERPIPRCRQVYPETGAMKSIRETRPAPACGHGGPPTTSSIDPATASEARCSPADPAGSTRATLRLRSGRRPSVSAGVTERLALGEGLR
jgi:hypothetical protein